MTSRSVVFFWMTPEFSLPAEYTISGSRVTGSGQKLCPNITHNTAQVSANGSHITIPYTDLEEFSVYIFTLMTTFRDPFLSEIIRTTSSSFVTLSSGIHCRNLMTLLERNILSEKGCYSSCQIIFMLHDEQPPKVSFLSGVPHNA